MRQSRDPELLRWLTALGPRDEYVYRCALLRLLPDFRADYEFKSATEALRVKLRLGETKPAAIWRGADRAAATIKHHLGRDQEMVTPT